MPDVITNNLDLWTSALLTKSTAGRGSNGKLEAYGIKKLRELILELAVRVKLVPQDPNDEPASVLLEGIARENAHLIKKGEIRKQKDLSPISKDEVPFVLPANWEIERLGTVSHLITKGTTPTTLGYAYAESGISFIKVENIDRGRIRVDAISQFIDKETNQALERSQLAAGDVLFSIAGTIGKTCIVYEKDLPANTNQALAIIRGTSTVFDTRYLIIQLDSFVAEATRSKARGGAMPNVSLGDLNVLVLPVPPMAEQHRIVAKVDELMALCDQLDQQQTNNIEAHHTLVEILLGTLINVESQEEVAEAWTRIANNFDALFTTEQSIDQFKQTILQLAVMGKLVPQDPSDEPASLLLEKIACEKEQLVKEGKMKKQSPLPEIGMDEPEYKIPEGWEWCRLQDVTRLITDGKHGDCNNLPSSGYFFLSAKDIQNGELLYENARQIVPAEFEEVHQRTDLSPGDICMVNTGATVGKMAIATENEFTYRTTFQKSVAVIKVATPFVDLQYIANYLLAETPKLLIKSGGSAINNLLLGDLKKRLVPLPPLSEQHLIVTKVNELMTLCGTLKARLAAAQTTQIHLADTIVEQAVT